MGMRTHVDAATGAKYDGAEVVKEDEGADHPAFRVRDGATNFEIAEIDAAWHDHIRDGVACGRISGGGVLAGEKAHR